MAETLAELRHRLAVQVNRTRRAERKAAAANVENEALRREVRTMRHANYILRANYERTDKGAYRLRFEKLSEALQIIREVAKVEANGLPEAVPTTLEPWLGPSWARVKQASQDRRPE